MIPIQNVYYMLSYAFRVLNEQGYKSIATEEFHNVAELCASILTKGVSLQLKRGLGKEYISETEALSSPRGKIDVTASIKDLSKVKGQLVCTYDDFSVNSYMNMMDEKDGEGEILCDFNEGPADISFRGDPPRFQRQRKRPLAQTEHRRHQRPAPKAYFAVKSRSGGHHQRVHTQRK